MISDYTASADSVSKQSIQFNFSDSSGNSLGSIAINSAAGRTVVQPTNTYHIGYQMEPRSGGQFNYCRVWIVYADLIGPPT